MLDVFNDVILGTKISPEVIEIYSFPVFRCNGLATRPSSTTLSLAITLTVRDKFRNIIIK